MADKPIGCARPSGSVVGDPPPESASDSAVVDPANTVKEESMSSIMVGRKAPDFSAPEFHEGDFGEFKLSDYLGKWVLLCFYPGDFTFV